MSQSIVYDWLDSAMTASAKVDQLDQRYYTSQFGRFMSADRFRQTPNANDSGSWNQYAYTQNDPANFYDPSGQSRCSPDGACDTSDDGPGGVGWPGDPTPCTAVYPRLGSPACVAGNGGEGDPGWGGGRPAQPRRTKKDQALADAQAQLPGVEREASQLLGQNTNCWSSLFGTNPNGTTAAQVSASQAGLFKTMTIARPSTTKTLRQW
jgi:RHS repeat-associated protein